MNAEPGVDEDGLAALEAAGRTVRRWAERHHYFGGVSAVGKKRSSGRPAAERRSARGSRGRLSGIQPTYPQAGQPGFLSTVPPAAGFE